jgi:hypothetical protein
VYFVGGSEPVGGMQGYSVNHFSLRPSKSIGSDSDPIAWPGCKNMSRKAEFG